MPVSVVVGGQFGSEGKGKVAHYLAKEKRATIAIRVGGSNSGHTVIDETGAARIFRVLPTASILKDTICVLGAGSYLDVDILLHEITTTGLTPDRLLIDPNAYIVTEDHKRLEREWGLNGRIGSTQSGTGAAVIDRIQRISGDHLAQNDERISKYVKPVRSFLRSRLKREENVIIEGTQGYGLSLLHSPHYPKATSRDTTAAAFVAESGLSPLDVDDVVLVIRAFPIRVPGDSGKLPNEIDWDVITREGGWPNRLIEYTSVTKKVRRIARFDAAIVQDAIDVNQPTTIVLNHADFFDAQSQTERKPTPGVTKELLKIELLLKRRIDLVGLGPDILESWESAIGHFHKHNIHAHLPATA